MSTRKSIPDPAYLHQILRLDPWKGDLYWRERPQEHFKTERAWKIWNTKWSGKRAGNAMGRGYRQVSIDNVQYQEHRLIWSMDHWDDAPPLLDHYNGDTADNRPANLRPCTNAENVRHRTGLDRNNTSGYRGVCFHKQVERWEAHIKLNGKKRRLGYYDTPEEAAVVAKEARERLFGEFAGLV